MIVVYACSFKEHHAYSRQKSVPLRKVLTGLEINFLVYWSIVQCIQIFTGRNASCTGQVLEQLK